ncbi:unnamed protein product [Echinostoma caproni]|uniref:Inactive rhomboid protein 1 n=1 Tax=Echinostoma caproni TaxID=27848 RepID=A0A183AIU8_9TREM|nr:unnamed protein product [Echinostoma caproni]
MIISTEKIPRRELSCDTGLGPSLMHSARNESGSDVSRWSGQSIESNRTFSSGDCATDHGLIPSSSSSSASNADGGSPNSIPFPSVPCNSTNSNGTSRVIRVYYPDEQDGCEKSQNDPFLLTRPNSLLPAASSRPQLAPRITVQPALNRPGPGSSTSKCSDQLKLHCSRLPAYHQESSVSYRRELSAGKEYQNPLDVQLIPAHQSTRDRDIIMSTNPHLSSTAIAVGYEDHPLPYEFHPPRGEQGTQTNRVAYAFLPKLPGTVSAAWSGRPGARTPEPGHVIRQSQRVIPPPCEYDLSSSPGSLSITPRTQSVQPVRSTAVSPVCANRSTCTLMEGRMLVHSRSGELITCRPMLERKNMMKSSSGLLSSTSNWIDVHMAITAYLLSFHTTVCNDPLRYRVDLPILVPYFNFRKHKPDLNCCIICQSDAVILLLALNVYNMLLYVPANSHGFATIAGGGGGGGQCDQTPFPNEFIMAKNRNKVI